MFYFPFVIKVTPLLTLPHPLSHSLPPSCVISVGGTDSKQSQRAMRTIAVGGIWLGTLAWLSAVNLTGIYVRARSIWLGCMYGRGDLTGIIALHSNHAHCVISCCVSMVQLCMYVKICVVWVYLYVVCISCGSDISWLDHRRFWLNSQRWLGFDWARRDLTEIFEWARWDLSGIDICSFCGEPVNKL